MVAMGPEGSRPDELSVPRTAVRRPALERRLDRLGCGELGVPAHDPARDATTLPLIRAAIARGMPATFGLSDVIAGWTEGVALMVEGERTRFWIPENLAYKGELGQPRGMLVFDIELIRIES